jgi:hypothetical protein
VTSVVPAGNRRIALPDVVLPDPLPTRVYISGHEYKIAAPRVALPPLLNAVRVIINWSLPFGRIAKNIFYLKTAGGVVTSDPVTLKTIADFLHTTLTTAPVNIQNIYTPQSNLFNVTVKDCGGTTAQATSSVASAPGVFSGNMHPPNTAIVLSWQIAEAYRGGKPRWYIPGVPLNATSAAGSPGISTTYAGQVEAVGTSFMAQVNAHVLVGGGTMTLGTVSYFSGHTVRPTPLFRTFINAVVHERLDSQRRRLGPEAAWPTVP